MDDSDGQTDPDILLTPVRPQTDDNEKSSMACNHAFACSDPVACNISSSSLDNNESRKVSPEFTTPKISPGEDVFRSPGSALKISGSKSARVAPPQMKSAAKKILGESVDAVDNHTYNKWDSMKIRGFSKFYRDHQKTFQRRMRRGVPQDFRWAVWREVTSCNQILASANASVCFELQPNLPSLIAAGINSGAENTNMNFNSSDLLTKSESSDASDDDYPDSTKLSDNQSCQSPEVSSRERYKFLNSLFMRANEITPCELFDLLADTPSRYSALIDIDVARTFPEVSDIFGEKAQHTLRRTLNAYSNFAPHVGYCQGMNFVVGLLIIVSDFACDNEIFWLFACLMHKYKLFGFFQEDFPLLSRYVQVYDHVIEFYSPELVSHFATEGIFPPVYLHQWFLTLFVTNLPLGTVAILWDFIICQGLESLLSITVALLKIIQSFLLRLKFEDVVKFLKSLKSSGECDEAKIGQLLIRQAARYPIPAHLINLLDSPSTPVHRPPPADFKGKLKNS